MKKILLVFAMIISAVLAVAVEKPSFAKFTEGKPNIVLIFIDDMGYGDIGPFGNTVNKTPHLDRMADEGMKFTNFYVSSTMCTPSRSALMTGCYADRIGMDGPVLFPIGKRGLNPSEITIAEMLKENGYVTGCFGKWHLGDQPEFLPLQQGFDEYAGIPYSNDMIPIRKEEYPPLPYIRGNKPVAHIPDALNQALLCEVVTNDTIDFIKRRRDEPFFLYVPHAYVHFPRYARKDLIDKANGDITRAQIEEVDSSVGQILDTLRSEGIAQKTLVVFLSDNGGAGGTSMGPLRGGKGGDKYEGHMRTPTLFWWPGTIEAGAVCDEIAETIDLFPTIAKLTDAKLPSDRIIDGKDITSLLFDRAAKSPHKVRYYEYDGIRRGPWKLVVTRKGPELYNLDKDIGENKNLAENHPKMVKELLSLIEKHKDKVQSAMRPAAFVDAPKPLIDFGEEKNLPTLQEYLGLPDVEVGGVLGNNEPMEYFPIGQ